ncbi:hypothetical protein Thal_0659 [Thermocrinis albus DSM 14484]|uniref:Uncharacterized protein n=1 Tax=Thermocrinis albus (strain DSM 14484 / JCM 11386 / HI 11/12) TaxID=638303 RepID=D3SQ55_THEAH|nr:hypothetical protein [Thermocrinis albus]ADC89292.1 hypothetical protein Thal_0659 [Thermocrinis albus DSM 14484]
MDISKLELLAQEVRKNMANPDIDIEVCFPTEQEAGCGTVSVPYLKVKYVVEGHSIHEKRIDIDPEYMDKDVKDLANFITFQIEQFMEEIDSVEYGGE